MSSPPSLRSFFSYIYIIPQFRRKVKTAKAVQVGKNEGEWGLSWKLIFWNLGEEGPLEGSKFSNCVAQLDNLIVRIL